MQWDRTLSVGVDRLDAQHKKLIDLVNRLHDAMREGAGQKVVGSVLQELAAYARDHFADEETLMRRAGYADTVAHVAEHARLTDDVGRLQHEQAAGNLLTMDVMFFLRSWLLTHIMQSDKRYTSSLQQANVA
jgi:hemerythrin